MSMSGGGVDVAVPTLPEGEEPTPPSSSASSVPVPTPVPPVPPSFSLPSSSFTFPGSFAPASGFSFPAPPSFPYPNPPSNVLPSSGNSSVSPFPMPGGFSYQGNSPSFAPQAAMTGLHAPGSQVTPQSAQAPALHGATPQVQTTQSESLSTSGSVQDSHTASPSKVSPEMVPVMEGQQLNPNQSVSDGLPLQSVPAPVTMPAQAVQVPAQPQGQGAIFPTALPSATVLPPPPLIGARPLPPPSATLSVVPPHPVYPTNHVAGVPLAPPGVLGSAPAGMGPRFPLPPYGSVVRPSNFVLRAPNPLVRPLPGTMLRPGMMVRPQPLVEKPQTLVYVGKIASTVDDDFLKSILEFCGPVKSWKRAQEPAVGSFGFCEFETPEGVLRALRLLNGFSLDGRELKLTVTQVAHASLERYIQRKQREQQLKLAQEMEVEMAPGVEAPAPAKQPEALKDGEDTTPDEKKFGIVDDEDKEADEVARKKLTALLEERAKLPPPPPLPSASDAPGKSTSAPDTPAKSRDGDSVVEGGQADGHEGPNQEETSENKANSEVDRPETSSSDRGRQLDDYRDRDRERNRDRGRDREIRDRERERERERRREKDWQYERMERDRERDLARRERERELQIRDADRRYEEREKYWVGKEKERERRRMMEREEEKEREKARHKLIRAQEEDSDDEGSASRWRRGDKRKKVQREREEDERDRIREAEEEVEAKRRKLREDYEEEVKKRLAEMAKAEAAQAAADLSASGVRDVSKEQEASELQQQVTGLDNHISMNGTCKIMIDEDGGSVPMSLEKQNSSPAPKKLGFGLAGSGKRTAVPSVFNQEDEEEAPKDRGLRQLVPIDYTADEMQVASSLKVNSASGSVPLNLAAAAEFAKSIASINRSSKEGHDDDRSTDRQRGKHRYSENSSSKLDAKQLIDTIPKTKDELFAYKIDWKIFDQHELHEKLRPWIRKKMIEFLGEEDITLVDFIVSNTRKHANAASLLELLTTILDEEAEMFVIKMWRMLIFEIKKVEMGLPSKSKG